MRNMKGLLTTLIHDDDDAKRARVRKVASYRLDPKLIDLINHASKAIQVSNSAVVRAALWHFFDRDEKDPKTNRREK